MITVCHHPEFVRRRNETVKRLREGKPAPAVVTRPAYDPEAIVICSGRAA